LREIFMAGRKDRPSSFAVIRNLSTTAINAEVREIVETRLSTC
jgi:hypothetical protein